MKQKTATFFKKHSYTIDHITDVNNLAGILEHGLLAHNNPYKKVDISNKDVNARRNITEPVYKKNLHDYVPLYFNPRNAMLYRNQSEHGLNIIVLGIMPEIMLLDKQMIITDGNAASSRTLFSRDVDMLSELNFIDIHGRSWTIDGERDEELKRKMMAEILIYKKIDMKYLKVIFCQTVEVAKFIQDNYKLPGDINVQVNAGHVFFKKFM